MIFFQIVDKNTIQECYPDGHDLSTMMSKIVWENHYNNNFEKEKLLQVKSNKDKIEELEDIINHMRYTSPVMVCNSHKFCYDFIEDNFNSEKYDEIKLVNIDMHHDLFNNNENIDCGNWINFVQKNHSCNVIWICNPISREVYGIKEDTFNMVREDFEEIKDEIFDLLFLCRSDAWTPPHLDNDFNELFNYICENFENVTGEKTICTPREIHIGKI